MCPNVYSCIIISMSGKRNRPVRYNIPGHAHELTFSCLKRQPLLDCKHARQLLADSVNSAAVRHNFDVWAWVIMPEHFHLLIFPCQDEYSISGILKSIKQPMSQSYQHWCRENNVEQLEQMKTGLRSPEYRFWQKGGGYDRNYWSADTIRTQINYIHLNPVRRGLVENPEDWEWSSAGYWLKDSDSRIRIEKRHLPF